MTIPKIKPETMGSIIEELYVKKEEFGLEDFASGLQTENEEVELILYSFIDALADYMADEDPIESEKYSAVAKISCNLLYKTIQKQIEINEMNHD